MGIQGINHNFYGWKNVGLFFCIHFLASGLAGYSYSVIFPAMIKDMNWPRGQASLAQTLALLVIGLSAAALAVCIGKVSLKKCISAGLLIMVIGLTLLSAVTTRLWIWVAIWGLILPVGLVFGGMIAIQTAVMLWFNIRRALALGVATSGGAAAGALAQPFFTWFMEASGSWRLAWLVIAGTSLIALALSFLVVGSPREIGQIQDGLSDEERERAKAGLGRVARTYRSPVEWPLKEVFKRPAVWLISLLSISHGLAVVFIMAHGVLHLTDVGFSSMQAASTLSLIILASGVAALPVGWVADLVETHWLTVAGVAGMLVSFIIIWAAPGMILLTAAGLIFGFSFGAILILMPATVGNFFGAETFPRINAVLVPVNLIFMATVPAAGGFVADKTGSYNLVFSVISLALVIGTICAVFLSPPRPTFYQKTD